MRFRDITSISGKPGLFKMESHKPSGLIVTSLTEGWTKFVSNREHLFSPLDNISIYTADDTVELLDVLLKAYAIKETNPPIDAKSDNAALSAYFEKILPEYDKEKVHIRDIKKFIKWFQILEEKGILQTELEEKEKESVESAVSTTETETSEEKA
jgi:hypothetical protein